MARLLVKLHPGASLAAAEARANLRGLRRYADGCFYLNDRKKLFDRTREQRERLHGALVQAFAAAPKFAEELGVDPGLPVEVHELRRSIRVAPDGRHVPQIVAALTQSMPDELPGEAGRYRFRGGSTLVIDLVAPAISYRIVKNIKSPTRRERTRKFLAGVAADPVRQLLFAPRSGEPFAAVHALTDVGWAG